jgi:chromosome segregation ATPase
MYEPTEEPLEIELVDFAEEYRKIRSERDSCSREIRQLREAIRQEKDDYAAEHDRLVQEQQVLTDEKCQEADELQATLRKLRAEVEETRAAVESTQELDAKVQELTAACETVDQQEALFIEELNRYTRALLELGSSSATTGNELLLGGRRTPNYRGSNHTEAAALAQSLYSLKMVLIKRYAESINSGCNTQ